MKETRKMNRINQIDNKENVPGYMARHGSSNSKDPKLPKGMKEKGYMHA